MSSRNDDRAATIKGVITLPDGSTNEFRIFTDGGWQQWGAETDRLGRSVPIIEAMTDALVEESLLVSDSDPEPDDEDTCRHCGESIERRDIGDGNGMIWVDDTDAMHCNDDDSGERHEPVTSPLIAPEGS